MSATAAGANSLICSSVCRKQSARCNHLQLFHIMLVQEKKNRLHCTNCSVTLIFFFFSPSFFDDQVEELKKNLEDVAMMRAAGSADTAGKEWATKVPPGKATLDTVKVEDIEEDTHQPPAQLKVNGHHCPLETNGHHGQNNAPLSEKICLQNGSENPPLHPTKTPVSSCGSAPSALPPSSPCASPVLAKRPPGSPSPANYQSPYQAGINQRFHAARHKFQGAADPESQSPAAAQPALPVSPKEVSPVTNAPSQEPSPVKQMARSTVTQVLSRFTTVQQSAAPKLTPPNNSPFGTDYRSLAAPLSPIIGRAAGALQQGIRSPTIPRADRGNPPPIPPKKPGLAQAPPSPAAVPRSGSHFSDSPLSGSCGLTSSQEGVKELDMVVSSN